MADFNPFGLVGTAEVRKERRELRRKSANVRRQRLNGVDYGNAEVGNAIGMGIRALLGKAGIMPDEEMETAKKVDSAVKRAQVTTRSIPDELRAKDPIQASIQERQELIQELDASGLYAESDKVRQSILDLKEKQIKMRKLNAETTSAEAAAMEDAATVGDDIATTKANRLKADASARITISDANFRPMKNEFDLRNTISQLEEREELRPLVRDIKGSEARIKMLEARLGGPLPNIVRAQNEREHVLAFLRDNPNDRWAQKRLKEINDYINNEATNTSTVKNIDNYQPTTAVLTQTQNQIKQLQTATDNVANLMSMLDKPGESVGNIPQIRAGLANQTSQILPLLGMPQQLTSSLAETIAPTSGILEPQALARKLKVELLPIVNNGSRTTPQDIELLTDLIQAVESSTSDRESLVALGQTLDFISSIQEKNYQVLAEGLRGIVPQEAQSDPRQPASSADIVNSQDTDLNAYAEELLNGGIQIPR